MSKSNYMKPGKKFAKAESKKYQVDVIIPVHRRIDLLEQCLDALPAAMGDISYKVILWDNGTPKEERDPLYSKLYKDRQFTISENSTNLGFPIACNKSAKRGYAPFIFLLNSDVILDPGSVKLLVQEMDKDPKLGVVGMKLLFPEDVGDLNYKIRPAGKIQHIGLASNIRGEIIHILIGWDTDNPKVNRVRDVLGVTGAALLTRRPIWQKIGGFYEGFGQGTYEDIDYCMNVRSLGYNIIVVPEATGKHYVGATAEKYQIQFPLNMNKLIFNQRWMNRIPWTEAKTW